MTTIAIITQPERNNYLTNTILDGLFSLREESNNVNFCISPGDLGPRAGELSGFQKNEKDFLEYAHDADIIFWCHGRKHTNNLLAQKLSLWEKTIIIDGSELGKNRRYDTEAQKETSTHFEEYSKISDKIRFACPLYFRREKPYLEGITPLPFGIESRYMKHYKRDKEKDIDFVCIFGQEEYPALRKYTREATEEFCKENGFSCITKKTKNSDEFYELLSRAKVGISVGGGGFDTMRFWEILGNNCLLLTERIDIYHPDSKELEYARIYQFNNLSDFKYQLKKAGEFLRNGYNQKSLNEEYQKILTRHGSKARVAEVLRKAKTM